MHDDERNVLLTRGRDWFHCGVCFNSLDIFSNIYLSEFYFFCFTAYFQATVHSTMGNKRRLVNASACYHPAFKKGPAQNLSCLRILVELYHSSKRTVISWYHKFSDELIFGKEICFFCLSGKE